MEKRQTNKISKFGKEKRVFDLNFIFILPNVHMSARHTKF